jgi:hypothetical protein
MTVCCIRCRRVLAMVDRGHLWLRDIEVRVTGAAWLYCPDGECGGWAVYRPRAIKA